MKLKITIIHICSILLISSNYLMSQEGEIDKKVLVTKAYQPIITDANKISVQPNYKDSTRIQPNYEYKVNPIPIPTEFSVRPIKAARMVGVPLDKLYNTYIKAGIGNYITPYAEISLNNLRSREYSLTGYAYHKSSSSKIPLDNDDKVNGSYAHNKIRIDASKFEQSLTWGGSIGLNSNTYHLYGYNTNIFSDSTLPDISGNDIKNRYNYVFGDLFVKSTLKNENILNYNLKVQFGYFYDNHDYKQQVIKADAFVKQKINDFTLGLDISSLYNNPVDIDTLQSGLLNLNPYFCKSEDDWYLKIGFKGIKDLASDGKFYIRPDVLLQLNIIKNILTPYAGVTGGLSVNDYYSIVKTNPYIQSGTTAGITNQKIAAFAGFKGGFNTKAFFNLQAKLEYFDNYLLFAKDTTTNLENNFVPLLRSNNLNRNTYSAEMIYMVNRKLMVSGTFHYFVYNLSNLANGYPDKAWNLPNYKANLYIKYNLQDKLTFEANTYFTGKRFGLNIEDRIAEELKAYTDINFATEYKYNKFLSFYLQLQNILNTKYDLWYQYPSQGIKVLIGFSYTL